jgi:MoaA/NifB/PqqE/SkfB family radical SAM enzyme
LDGYIHYNHISEAPRLPLAGNLDVTYRCNNHCLHCWLWIQPDAERDRELALDEIKDIADQAKIMGCRQWNISGGEPLLRPDFPEIFEYLTAKGIGYTLNTNGTLITPEIARLLKRKGVKLIALYGATAETHDRITRHSGSHEMTLQGIRYLKEAGAGFMVQLVPMRANWHEWEKMKGLAESLSGHWRVGASFLQLSACRNRARNVEIAGQRLDPREIVEIDPPDSSVEGFPISEYRHTADGGGLFSRCVAGRNVFYIDPYGSMTFCSFIKDPALRFDLRRGSFEEGWEKFLPSLADRERGGSEYRENCGVCPEREACFWCPAFGWLEHGRFTAPVEHFCDIARETRRYRNAWEAGHRRYYHIGGITIRVESDLPFHDNTFHPRFGSFRAEGPGVDNVSIRHHFGIPDLKGIDLGKELYRNPPWAISTWHGSFYYLGISPDPKDPNTERLATFNADHSRGRIYNDRKELWEEGGLGSLTLFPSDQILVGRLLADRQGCYLHSAGAILNGAGMLFVGHSEAGKSTLTRHLIEAGRSQRMQVEILCDDRNIVRRLDGGWRVYGSWSHGDVPLVSGNDAPLKAVCFIEKSDENRITPMTDRRAILRRLLACVIRPLVTADWWMKTLELVERMSQEDFFYRMQLDKSGEIICHLEDISASMKFHHTVKGECQ